MEVSLAERDFSSILILNSLGRWFLIDKIYSIELRFGTALMLTSGSIKDLSELRDEINFSSLWVFELMVKLDWNALLSSRTVCAHYHSQPPFVQLTEIILVSKGCFTQIFLMDLRKSCDFRYWWQWWHSNVKIKCLKILEPQVNSSIDRFEDLL